MASSTFWNSTFVLLLYLSAGREMTSASILLKLHGLEDGVIDPKDFEVYRPEGSNGKPPTAEKRQSTTGTCTCTCETKPAGNATSSEWTAETSADESPRKQPSYPAPGMVASSLRTDTSGRRQGASSAAAAGVVKPKMLSPHPLPDADDSDAEAAAAADDADGGGELNDDSNQIVDADFADSSQSDWGHGSRFLWKRLPDRMCYREPCLSDKDCCLWYNLCDRSAKVCVDCWYGSPCTSERDCCIRYPYCELEEDRGHGQGGKRSSYAGQCVDQIS